MSESSFLRRKHYNKLSRLYLFIWKCIGGWSLTIRRQGDDLNNCLFWKKQLHELYIRHEEIMITILLIRVELLREIYMKWKRNGDEYVLVIINKNR